MPGLGQTVSELMLRRMREAAARPPAAGVATPLAVTQPMGSNPGQLRMLTLVPPGLPPGAPLVVVLHGCTQTAASFDVGAGWSELARRHGFALLYPEQQAANNANTCFNWFGHDDVTRGRGEVASVAQMIEQTVAQHGLDPARVYITGLSAGGAMACAMLATYPELFAGGAVIAGLPFGAASGVSAALDAMRHCRSRSAAEWGDLVRQASGHRGRRAPVQIWHGAADATVRPAALEELAKQWGDVAGVSGAAQEDEVDGTAHRVWRAPGGTVAVETFLVPGLGHGVPLHTAAADLDESVGTPSPYMLESPIGSTRRIAQSWGLLTQAPRARAPRRERPTAPGSSRPGMTGVMTGGMNGMVERVLRRAGLDV